MVRDATKQLCIVAVLILAGAVCQWANHAAASKGDLGAASTTSAQRESSYGGKQRKQGRQSLFDKFLAKDNRLSKQIDELSQSQAYNQAYKRAHVIMAITTNDEYAKKASEVINTIMNEIVKIEQLYKGKLSKELQSKRDYYQALLDVCNNEQTTCDDRFAILRVLRKRNRTLFPYLDHCARKYSAGGRCRDLYLDWQEYKMDLALARDLHFAVGRNLQRRYSFPRDPRPKSMGQPEVEKKRKEQTKQAQKRLLGMCFLAAA